MLKHPEVGFKILSKNVFSTMNCVSNHLHPAMYLKRTEIIRKCVCNFSVLSSLLEAEGIRLGAKNKSDLFRRLVKVSRMDPI